MNRSLKRGLRPYFIQFGIHRIFLLKILNRRSLRNIEIEEILHDRTQERILKIPTREILNRLLQKRFFIALEILIIQIGRLDIQSKNQNYQPQIKDIEFRLLQ